MPVLPPEPPGEDPAVPCGRPLPDPASIQLCRVPDAAPPYDEAQAVPRQAFPAPPPPTADVRSPRARAGGLPVLKDPGDDAGLAVSPNRFAQVLAETLAGSRPPRQMAPWTTERTRARIQRLGAQMSSAQPTSARQPQVRRVVASHPASGVVEMTVVVGFGGRVRALAVRLEHTGPGARGTTGTRPPQQGWVCTAFEAA